MYVIVESNQMIRRYDNCSVMSTICSFGIPGDLPVSGITTIPELKSTVFPSLDWNKKVIMRKQWLRIHRFNKSLNSLNNLKIYKTLELQCSVFLCCIAWKEESYAGAMLNEQLTKLSRHHWTIIKAKKMSSKCSMESLIMIKLDWLNKTEHDWARLNKLAERPWFSVPP